MKMELLAGRKIHNEEKGCRNYFKLLEIDRKKNL